ncbi:hypothetical protein [Cupriavidus pauculus]|uniref:hypothetical protein n=1 Tax=Cupriavidus pauculus TaxID=82633 RepID=UPI004040F4A1
MSGLDAVPRMRAVHADVRVLVLTAQDAVPFAARAMQARAQGLQSSPPHPATCRASFRATGSLSTTAKDWASSQTRRWKSSAYSRAA